MYLLYTTPGSGNCHKIRLLMHQLRIPFQEIQVDVLAGETRKPVYLAINPNGTVPYLLVPDGRGIGESNAILLYLAAGSQLLPDDPYERALVHEWLFWEQSSLEPAISPARFWTTIVPSGRAERAAQISAWQERGRKALSRLDAHLSGRAFLLGDRYTVADIGVFGYGHVSHEAGIDFDAYPAVKAWIARVEDTDRFLPMTTSVCRAA